MSTITLLTATLGAWLTFADPFYATSYATHKVTYCHLTFLVSARFARRSDPCGTTCAPDELVPSSCMVHIRVQHYLAFAVRQRANVLALNRGFPESAGLQSEAGAMELAARVWRAPLERTRR